MQHEHEIYIYIYIYISVAILARGISAPALSARFVPCSPTEPNQQIPYFLLSQQIGQIRQRSESASYVNLRVREFINWQISRILRILEFAEYMNLRISE